MRVSSFIFTAIFLVTSLSEAYHLPKRRLPVRSRTAKYSPLKKRSFPAKPIPYKGKNQLTILSGNSQNMTYSPLYLGGSSQIVSTGWMNPSSTLSLTFSTGSFSGSSDMTVISDDCSGKTLGPGQVCYVEVELNPANVGPQRGTLTHSYNYHPITPPVTGTTTINFSGMVIDENAVNATPAKPLHQSEECGSLIGVDSQSLGEAIPIVGTDFSLVYSSEHAESLMSYYEQNRHLNWFNPQTLTVSIHHSLQQEVLYKGSGGTERVGVYYGGATNMAANSAGTEVYLFDSKGKHLETKTFLTGATKYLFHYDSNERLSSIEDGFGNITTFNRNTSGALTSIVAPHGQTTLITSSGLYITEVKNPALESYVMTYKADTDLLETFTKPGGEVSTLSYNSEGKLTQDLGNAGNFWSLVSTINVGNTEVAKSSKMGRTSYARSSSEYGYPGVIYRDQVDPSGLEHGYVDYGYNSTEIWRNWDWTYNESAFDNRVHFYNRIGSTTTEISNVESTTYFGQSVTGTGSTFDPFTFSSLTNTKTTSGRVSTTVYNSSTKTSTTTSQEGATSSKTFNSHEQPTSFQVGADTPWTYSYDTYGRLIESKQGTSQNKITNTYNSAGYLQKTTNARNEETSYSYDSAGRVTQVTLPDLRFVGYSYNSNGRLTGVTPPSRPQHVFDFNIAELVSAYKPPTLTGLSVKDTQFYYNNDKQLTSVLRPDGQSAAYGYGSTTGLLNSITLARGNFDYTYIANDDLAERVDSPDGLSNGYEYYGTTIMSESSMRSSDDFLYGKVSFSFDSDHRYSGRTVQGNSSGSAVTTSLTLNGDDVPTQVGNMSLVYSYPSGRLDSTSLDNISDSRTYDTYGNLESYSVTYTPTVGSPQVLYAYTLTRDSMSRIVGKSETVLGVTDVYDYAFDDAGRLTDVTKNSTSYSHFVYDDNGNKTSGTNAGTSFTATYDDQDRMLTYNSRAYSYNANGDNTGIAWSIAANSAFSYDALGNLLSSTLPSGSVVSYKYDGSGRQSHVAVDGVTETRRIYENDYRIAAETDDSGNLGKVFVYETSENAPDYMIYSGNRYRFIRDHLGSPRLIVRSSDGVVVQRLDYTEFGKVTGDTSPGFQPYGFAGGIYDRHTGLVKFGQRYYDPETGRWTSKDPILFNGGNSNLYGYVQNDPVNFVDPEGLFELPANPSGLPEGWVIDPTHKNPNGSRWRNSKDPSRYLDFHPGNPNGTRGGNQKSDHWHDSLDGRHKPRLPGEEVPDPQGPCPDGDSGAKFQNGSGPVMPPIFYIPSYGGGGRAVYSR